MESIQNQSYEKIVEMLRTLIHEKEVYAPRIQEMVAIKEEHNHVNKEISNYVEKLVGVEHNAHHERCDAVGFVVVVAQ